MEGKISFVEDLANFSLFQALSRRPSKARMIVASSQRDDLSNLILYDSLVVFNAERNCFG